MRLGEDSLRLLEIVCTTEQVHSLLQRFRGRDRVRLTAENKEILIRRNLQDAIEAGVIRPEDVFKLIQDAEENGQQHIVYFQCSRRYGGTLSLDAVATLLWGKAWRSSMSFPKHETATNDYLFADARAWNPDKKPQDWVIKAYGQDTLNRLIAEEYEENGTVLIKKYLQEKKRRVLMVRWNAPDLLEVRVPSDESRSRIESWISRLWQMMKKGVQRSEFRDWDLSVARRNLVSQWNRNPAYQKMYSFRDTLIVDPYETAASFQPHSPQGNLFSSKYAKAAVDGLLESNSECAQITITWNKRDGEAPSKNLNTDIGLRRKTNELIVREHCSAADLDHVTQQLRHFNRKTS